MSSQMEVDECASFKYAENTASYLKKKINITPEVGIVCGSGLGGLAESIKDQIIINYKEIPGFTVSTVAGHSGKLVFGNLSGVPTVCMQGRFHYYEGHSLAKCVFPIRVMKLLGVKTMIVTNSAGATNAEYKVGDIMIIKDHINFLGFAGINPLRGPNDSQFGVRFPAMSNAYNADLRAKVKATAKDLGMSAYLREGVYVALGGPTYETVAEIRALRILGGDAVGMSTAPEVIVAHHCGMRVLGITLITNKCIADYDTHEIANHEEVLQTGELRKKDLEHLVQRTVGEIILKNGVH